MHTSPCDIQSKLVMALLIVFTLMSACAESSQTSPPTPRVWFPFDVSKQGSKVDQVFKIKSHRHYDFAIQFAYFSYGDMLRLLKLLGEGGFTPTGGCADPGIIVPIHLRIMRLEDGKEHETVYEGTVETMAIYAKGFEQERGAGFFSRRIIEIKLKPGIYQVEASTIKDSPEFTGTPSYFLIGYNPKVR